LEGLVGFFFSLIKKPGQNFLWEDVGSLALAVDWQQFYFIKQEWSNTF